MPKANQKKPRKEEVHPEMKDFIVDEEEDEGVVDIPDEEDSADDSTDSSITRLDYKVKKCRKQRASSQVAGGSKEPSDLPTDRDGFSVRGYLVTQNQILADWILFNYMMTFLSLTFLLFTIIFVLCVTLIIVSY